MGILPPDSADTCGYYWIHLPKDHPFNASCEYMHDPDYEAKHEGFPTEGRRTVDWALLKSWLGTAWDHKSPKLLVEALTLWPFVKIFGGIIWNFGTPDNATQSQTQSSTLANGNDRGGGVSNPAIQP